MATAKKITIHDVALAAGVSVSTVSLVLSELRVGRLWRGVWSSGAVLGDVVTHDA